MIKKHAHNYKGRIIKHKYVFIYMPEHPFCDAQGHVREHKLVYEAYLTKLNGIKTYIHPSLDIHHNNDDPQDNRIKNLTILTHSEHSRISNFVDMLDRICLKCKLDFTYKTPGGYVQWRRYYNGFICNKCYWKSPEYKEYKLNNKIRIVMESWF